MSNTESERGRWGGSGEEEVNIGGSGHALGRCASQGKMLQLTT